MIDDSLPGGHPMVAQVAIQQGALLASNLKAVLKGRPQKDFSYTDLGSMATIGRHRAVADLPFVKMQGRLAWFAWMFIHLMALVSFRNRVIVFTNWLWNYFSYDRAIRLIVRPFTSKE
jgi:NADH dehydrogenase